MVGVSAQGCGTAAARRLVESGDGLWYVDVPMEISAPGALLAGGLLG
jgi:hypothetical protein